MPGTGGRSGCSQPVAETATGGQPSSFSLRASTPSWDRTSSRSRIGRSRIRGTPSRRYRPSPKLTIAVRNRIVVPEFATNNSADRAGMTRPVSFSATATRFAAQSARTSKPSRVSDSTITSVSSLRSAPSRTHGPFRLASAASTSARLVMLLLPGTVTVADGGFASGTTSSSGGEGSDMRGSRSAPRRG